MTFAGGNKAGFGVAFVILFGVGIAAVFQTFAWEDSVRSIEHTHEVIEELDALALHSRDADEAAGQFTRTRENAPLIRFKEESHKARAVADRIQRLTADNPRQQRRMAALMPLIRAQQTAFRPLRPGASPRSAPEALAGIWQSGIERWIRNATIEMEREEHELLADRSLREASSARSTRSLFGLASIVSLLLLGIAAICAASDQKRRASTDRALLASEEKYRQVIESASDIIYRSDAVGRFTFCNQTALDTLHLTQEAVIGRSYLELIRPDARERAAEFYLEQFTRQQKTTYYEFPVVDGLGQQRWMGQNVQLLMRDGRVSGFQAIARDITERKRAEAALEESRQFVERIAATMPGILYVYDLETERNVFANNEIFAVLGYTPEQLREMENLPEYFCHPEDLGRLQAHYRALRTSRDGEVARMEYRVRHADGHWIWLSSRETPFLRGKDDLVKQITGIAQDITARRSLDEKLAYQANFDSLTRLANRHYFFERFEAAVRTASIERSPLTVCVLDIDFFKEINDFHGHSSGDEVLEELGRIARRELRSGDVAGRIGGDEFCFVLAGADRNEAARCAERVRSQLAALSFGLDLGSPFSVTASLGLAEWLPEMSTRELLESADRAMYRAKSAGRNRTAASQPFLCYSALRSSG